MLEIADGLKDSIIHAGFTIESMLSTGPEEIASTIGIDLYVARSSLPQPKRLLTRTVLCKEVI